MEEQYRNPYVKTDVEILKDEIDKLEKRVNILSSLEYRLRTLELILLKDFERNR